MRNWECHRAGEEPGWNCAISTPDPLLLLVAPRVPPVNSAVGGPGFPAHGPEHSLPGAVSVWAVPKHGLSFGFPPDPLWVSPHAEASRPRDLLARDSSCVLRHLTDLFCGPLRVDLWFYGPSSAFCLVSVSLGFPHVLPYPLFSLPGVFVFI